VINFSLKILIFINICSAENYVPCSHTVPMYVEPRPDIPDGFVRNATDLVNVFYDDMKEIPNPDPNFQPKF